MYDIYNMIEHIICMLYRSRRKFRSPTSDIWTVEKQSREVKSEERRYNGAKCQESRESLCFLHDSWVRRVEK